ncbi:hypothetical protein DNTS_021699 [Danionella cerebrum]|uniref:BHLH domain-containing protein n=1 Tax=Danionella cerebrum TaxID=2873325 RepID=A0A553P5C0_9TELE|nr:hypothetical protein DNTS_021699 [Danionella translucida]
MDVQSSFLTPVMLDLVTDFVEMPPNKSILAPKDSHSSSGGGLMSVPPAPEFCTLNGSKPRRKRVISSVQRHAANIRERKRMFSLNEAFERLRRRVPTFAYEKRLSRIETLRLAIVYIAFMTDILEKNSGVT